MDYANYPSAEVDLGMMTIRYADFGRNYGASMAIAAYIQPISCLPFQNPQMMSPIYSKMNILHIWKIVRVRKR